jgi:ABC-type tungstate transport system substrate-binding protein
MPTTGRITPDDIKSKFEEIQGDVEEVEAQALDYAAIAVVAVAVTVVVVAFLLGSRRGRKRRAIVEIRRI